MDIEKRAAFRLRLSPPYQYSWTAKILVVGACLIHLSGCLILSTFLKQSTNAIIYACFAGFLFCWPVCISAALSLPSNTDVAIVSAFLFCCTVVPVSVGAQSYISFAVTNPIVRINNFTQMSLYGSLDTQTASGFALDRVEYLLSSAYSRTEAVSSVIDHRSQLQYRRRYVVPLLSSAADWVVIRSSGVNLNGTLFAWLIAETDLRTTDCATCWPAPSAIFPQPLPFALSWPVLSDADRSDYIALILAQTSLTRDSGALPDDNGKLMLLTAKNPYLDKDQALTTLTWGAGASLLVLAYLSLRLFTGI